jgi:hypothetical protein
MAKKNDQPEAVKAMIAALPPNERAMLRPWLLAKFDVQGNARPRLPLGPKVLALMLGSLTGVTPF